VAFETGLRPNELFGLKRKDIEIGGTPQRDRRDIFPGSPSTVAPAGTGIIHVRQTYSRFGEGGTKTRGSRRSVPLSDAAVRALREQLAAVKLHSMWLWPQENGTGVTPPKGERPFDARLAGETPAAGSTPRNPQDFSRRAWPAILKRAGVEHREFYQCRHTYAARLLAQGVPMQEIAKRMGHASLRMLIDRYLKWATPEKAERRKVGR